MKEVLLFTRHPYTAGIIGMIWLGSTVLYAIDQQLPIVEMAAINMIVSFIIAAIGFRSGR